MDFSLLFNKAKNLEDFIRQIYICGILQDKDDDFTAKIISEYLKNIMQGDPSYNVTDKTVTRDIEKIEGIFNINIDKGKGRKNFRFPDIDADDNVKLQIILYTLLFSMDSFDLIKSVEELIKEMSAPVKDIVYLNIAIRKSHKIIIKHYNLYYDKEFDINVDPYKIIFNNGQWYLVGYSPYVEDYRQYLLKNIKSVKFDTNTDYYNNAAYKTFQKDPNFSIKDFYANSFKGYREQNEVEEYQIKISKGILDRIPSHSLPENYNIQEKKDYVYLEFKAAGMTGIVDWIWTLGNDAEIIKPKKARKYIKTRLRNLKKKY